MFLFQVHYYGMIKQSTGEEWENAYISLSTAQPDIGGSAPQLGIHYIGFQKPKALGIARYELESLALNCNASIEEDLIEAQMFSKISSRLKTRSLGWRGSRRSSGGSVSSLEVTVAKV